MSTIISILGILIATFFILFVIEILIADKNTAREKRITAALINALKVVSMIALICLFSAAVFFLLLCISSL
ncbi:MAG: hypothetical protein RR987_16490 [Hafnia sp.]|uniref:hypothetical protein n=1 Tax=Hafnia sp. TaxID=1873498 RepID=UPI002FC8B3C7